MRTAGSGRAAPRSPAASTSSARAICENLGEVSIGGLEASACTVELIEAPIAPGFLRIAKAIPASLEAEIAHEALRVVIQLADHGRRENDRRRHVTPFRFRKNLT
jgi:hypothetical protein